VTIVTAGELADDVQAFLCFKRAMGIPYQRGELVLNGFVRFVAQSLTRIGIATPEPIGSADYIASDGRSDACETA
jgi:integrase/recombinase XerD